MVKLGGNINAVPLGNDKYKMPDGKIINGEVLYELEMSALNRKSSLQKEKDKIKRKMEKKLYRQGEHMILMGVTPSRVNELINDGMERVRGRLDAIT